MVQRFYLGFFLRTEEILDETDTVLKEVARARSISLSDFLCPFQDIRAAMLLSCLPNLTRIYLMARSPWNAIPASALSAAGFSSLSLQTIDVCGAGFGLGHCLGGILAMSASTLRTLNIDMNNPYYDDRQGVLVCPLPNLRNICIAGGAISTSDLEQLLSCCVGLETFVLDNSKSSISWLHILAFRLIKMIAVVTALKRNHILPSNLIRRLSKHKETLTRLHLNIRKVVVPAGSILSAPRPSLRSFPALRHLFLNLAVIYYDKTKEALGDHDILVQFLPLSIVSLRLDVNLNAEVRARLAKGLLRLADAASQGQFPCMEMVRCYTEQPLTDDGLSEKFASAGVDFAHDPRPYIWRSSS